LNKKITETDSFYSHLEKMSVKKLLLNINTEDQKVARSIKTIIPKIESLVNVIIKKLKHNGRLFYIGAGTSGRLGIVDASECPPTFGVDYDLVIGLIAGGDDAIRKAIEFAEDNPKGGWSDLQNQNISEKDIVVGIAASGTTPYVVGAIKDCRLRNITTAAITCNKNSPLAKTAKFPIEVLVGPEFITGSTRMKAGTAQKLILNMISTSVMIKLGKIQGNKMVDMQLNNNKLVKRGAKILMDNFSITHGEAKKILLKYKSVRKALESHKNE